MTEIVTADDTDTDTDDDTPDTATEASQSAQDEPNDAAAVDDSDDDADDAQDDDEQPNKLGVRAKLKAVEASNVKLAAAVARAREALIDAAMDRAEVPADQRRALLRVIGTDELNECFDDDGLPDAELLLATVETARAELGLPRRPKPNTVAGRGRESTGSELPTTFAGVLAQHVASRDEG